MQKRLLGKTGLQLPVLGFGASSLGQEFRKVNLDEALRSVRVALDCGLDFIDTSPFYGRGMSEVLLGIALKDVPRDQYTLCTKLGRYDLAHFDFSARRVAESVDVSLHRLGTDHFDIVLCHDIEFVEMQQIVDETLPALRKIQQAGKTRFIGFSGVGEPPALHQAVESKLFDTVQVVYNALNPSAGGPAPKGMPGLDYGRLLDKAKAADMGTIIIRALAGGALSGTADRHPLAMQDVPPIGSALDFATDVARARQLEPLVREAGAESLAELAERFVISHPAVSTMLIGYSTLQHLDEAIAAVNKGPLPEKVLKKIG